MYGHVEEAEAQKHRIARQRVRNNNFWFFKDESPLVTCTVNVGLLLLSELFPSASFSTPVTFLGTQNDPIITKSPLAFPLSCSNPLAQARAIKIPTMLKVMLVNFMLLQLVNLDS